MLKSAEVQIAPSTYYATKTRPPSARSISDAALTEKITEMHAENYSVYGARKIHAELVRKGTFVARCTVERLMRAAGLRGVHRSTRMVPRTTVPGDAADRPSDLVERQFLAAAPNCLWVADITYINTFSGWVYAAFVIDVFSRRIVGWQVSSSLRMNLALDALEMGLWTRGREGADLTSIFHDLGSRDGARGAGPATGSSLV